MRYQKLINKMTQIKATLIRMLFPTYVINKCKQLMKGDNEKIAEKMLIQTVKFHPNNDEINLLLVEINMRNEKWDHAIAFLNKVIDRNKTAELYIKLSYCYYIQGHVKESEEVLQKGIKVFPKDEKLREKLIDIAISSQQWKVAKTRLEKDDLLRTHMESLIKLSMIYQTVGEHEKAMQTFQFVLDKYTDKISMDEKGYRKITLFDNGESRIEFYKKLMKTDQVIVTFDSINMEWQNPSFSFKLLARQNLDIVAIRKRKTQTYQQDLTQNDFVNTLSKLLAKYKDKVAYGFSLGAYNALYFSSLLNCRILALSPRLSIHPVYGRTKIIPKYEFRQNMSLPYNANISPTIVFDPKNELDNRYIHEEVLKSFPNARLIKIPYGGHGIAPHLLEMGQLKEFVYTIINNEIPKYNRNLRLNSPFYFMFLAEECKKHNKLRWALDLINKSLELLPTDERAKKLKEEILKEYNEAFGCEKQGI